MSPAVPGSSIVVRHAAAGHHGGVMAASGNLLQRGVLEYGVCAASIPAGGEGDWSARQDIWGGRTGVRWVVWEQERNGGWSQAEWLFRRYGCDFVFFLATAQSGDLIHIVK